MKISTIKSTWLRKGGFRLDCSPYLGGAIETEVLLESLPVRKEPLGRVTSAIFNGPKFSRTFVDEPEYGVRFLGGSDLQNADFDDLPMLSRAQAYGKQLRHLEIKPGMTLITCSGTIGKMAYARPDMEGIWSSQHIMKVVPNPDAIPSGYLYAFLSSRFGVPLVVSGTYGSIIQSIEPAHITGLSVPRFGDAVEHDIHQLVEEAARLRTQATKTLRSAQSRVIDFIGSPPTTVPGRRHSKWAGHSVSSGKIRKFGRLDPLFFNPVSSELDEWFQNHSIPFKMLGEIADVFDVPPFKHIYVDSTEGVAFFPSAALFDVDRTTDKYLSRVQTKGLKKYVLEEGWVLIARSGQLNGNIGKSQFVDSSLAGKTASDHVIRIVSKNIDFSPGYLYTYLSLPEWRYSLIQRFATGASIPALWPIYLNWIPILSPPAELSRELDDLVRSGMEMRVSATDLESKAQARLEKAISNHSK